MKGSDEKFCFECGAVIRMRAEICPTCGVRQLAAPTAPSYQAAPQPALKNKTIAAVLAIFLGGVGAHWFYLERPFLAVLSVLFCWTFIPAIFGFLGGINFLIMSDRSFQLHYCK